jgi:methionine synthase II (cobalamin-independent)
MPGTDYAEASRIVAGEVGELPYLVELPARGATASMTGRSLAIASELAFDLQPAGWRLTDASGIDHRRAIGLLAHDLDVAEELLGGRAPAYKIQTAGPWTLAATVERPRGDRLLADHGARRELAQALAEGVRAHCAEVLRRIGPAELILQIDEPALPAVLAGEVPTASGFSRHRVVDAHDASEALSWVAEAAKASGATTVLHCCAAELPFEVLTNVPLRALSFDLGLLSHSRYDDLAAWLDSGRLAWLGVVPSTAPTGPPPTASALTEVVLSWWRRLGYGDLETMPETVVTPTCGLAGADPRWAQQALGLCREIARNLSVEQGRIDL